MPCDTVQRNSVRLEAANLDILANALRSHPEFGDVVVNGNGVSAYHKPTAQWATIGAGRVSLYAGTEYVADTIKQAYTREAINVVAKKYDWNVEEVPGEANRLRLVR